ncbi:hypothetical protein HDV06_000902 [Boothiomyces sp. JEL0866]|nr:hypothetical protein HDV06_000902 [Boothiomyces sp. JEL0866]
MGKSTTKTTSDRIVYSTKIGDNTHQFFVYVEPNQVDVWRKDKSIPLVDVVQAFQIFESDNHSNQGIAMKPNKSTLSNAFGTEDETKIIEKILSDGKVMHTVNNGGSKGYVA